MPEDFVPVTGLQCCFSIVANFYGAMRFQVIIRIQFTVVHYYRTSFGLNVRRKRYYFILIKNEFLKEGFASFETKVDDAVEKVRAHFDGEVIDWSHPQSNFNASAQILTFQLSIILLLLLAFCMSAT